jgi:hypothetical protein
VLDVGLHGGLRVLAADQTPVVVSEEILGQCWGGECSLDVEDRVVRVGGGLVLGGVTDEALLIGEGDVGGSDTVTCRESVSMGKEGRTSSIQHTLVVDENLNLALGHDTNARVGTAHLLASLITAGLATARRGD